MSLSTSFNSVRTALTVTSSASSVNARNIEGRGEEGYARKRAVVSSGPDGVRVVRIERAADELLSARTLAASSRAGEMKEVATSHARIAEILSVSDSAHSLVGKLGSLARSIQTASTAPSDISMLGSVLNNAKNLVTSLHGAHAKLDELVSDTESQIAASVSLVNGKLGEFQTIDSMLASGPSDLDRSELMDRRDAILAEIAKEISISWVTKPDGSSALYSSGGVVLYDRGPREAVLRLTDSGDGARSQGSIFIDGVDVSSVSSSMPLTSGRLAGLLQIRDEIAPHVRFQLDEFAMGLVSAFSEGGPSLAGDPPVSAGLFVIQGHSDANLQDHVPNAGRLIAVNSNADPAAGGSVSLIRDGGISNPADPRYSENPKGDPGFSSRLLEYISRIESPRSMSSAAGSTSQLSLEQFSEQFIADIGERRMEAQGIADSARLTVERFQTMLTNATGVNLDEEMATMLSLENSYRASTKLLASVNSLYESLFSAIR